MAKPCKIKKNEIEILQDYVKKYGQADGIIEFLAADKKPLETGSLRQQLKIRKNMSFGELKSLYKRVDTYNVKHNTSHSIIANPIGESGSFNPEVVINNNPRNPFLKELRRERRSEEGKVFKDMPEPEPFQTELDFSPAVKNKEGLSSAFQELAIQMEAKIRDKERLKSKVWSKIKPKSLELKKSTSEETKVKLQQQIDDLLLEVTNIESDINTIQQDLDELYTDSTGENSKETAAFLSTVANHQLDQVESILNGEKFTSEQLKEVGATIDIWRNIRNLMFKDEVGLNQDMVNTLNAIQNRADSEEVFMKWWLLVNKHILELANFENTKELRLADIKKMVDIGVMKSLGIDAAQSGNRLLQTSVDLPLRNAMYRAQREAENWFEEIDSTFVGDKDFSRFFQKDSKGKFRGGLITRYSTDYDDTFAKVKNDLKVKLKAATDKSSKFKAYKEYFDFKRKNLVALDYRFFTNPKHTTTEFKSKEEYWKFLVDQFGEKRATELRNDAIDRYNKYKERRKLFEQDLDDRYKHGDEATEEDIDKLNLEKSRKLKNWINYNSPEVYLNQYDPKATLYFQQWNRQYIREVPRKYDTKGNETAWYDKGFEDIENDPKLMEQYQFISDLMYEMKNHLPNYIVSELKYNFLPQVRSDLARSISDKNIGGIWKDLRKEFIEGITSEEGLEKRFADIDPYTKKPYKHIPTRFLQAPKDAETSRDIPSILKAFTQMALTYKYLAGVEDRVLLAQRIIDNAVEVQLNNRGDIIKDRDRDTDLVEEKDGLLNLKKLTQYTIDAALHGEKKKDEGVSKKKLFEDKAEKERYKELERQRDELEEDLYSNKITEEEYNEKIKPLVEEAQTLGRNLVFSKVGDKLLRYNQLLTLGLNVFSGVNNWVFGVVSNVVWSAGRKDFAPNDVFRAYGMVMRSAFNLKNKKEDKISKLAGIFDIVGEGTEGQYGEGKPTNKTIEKIKNFPYIILRSGDFFIKAITMTSMMLHTKVNDKSGKERSLLDAFNNDGTWNEEEFGENKSWGGDINNPEEMKDFIKFRNKVIDVNKTLHGNFDPASPQMAKKWILGRMLGQFRLSWAATGIESRFGGRRYSDVLERDVEGRYRSYAKLGFTQSLKVLYNLVTMKGDKAFDEIKSKDIEIIKENMRKNLMEIYLYSMMATIYLMLKFSLDDDDEDVAGKKMLLNTLYRCMGDTTFYLSPSTFDQIVNRGNIIPVFQIYKNFESAMSKTTKYIYDDDTSTEDLVNAWGKNLPYWSQVYKVETMGKKLQ